MGKVNLWSEEEYNFIIKYYGEYGPKWCSKKLNRSSGAIQKKARELNLKFGGIKNKYHKENLEKIVENSQCVSDVLRKLGMGITGGNSKTIKKYIKKYEIDISHFDVNYERDLKQREYIKNVRIPLTEILIEGSAYNRTLLKKRLIKENLLEYKCEKCGNKGEWNNKPITLQLDHKNGVRDDHRVENLRFMCPNCHSQTETYGGRNCNK